MAKRYEPLILGEGSGAITITPPSIPEPEDPFFVEGGLYAIDWLDSGMQMTPQWDTVRNHMANWRLNDMRVKSVGTLVYIDDDVVGLGLSVSGANSEEQVFGLQLIVRTNIIEANRFDAE